MYRGSYRRSYQVLNREKHTRYRFLCVCVYRRSYLVLSMVPVIQGELEVGVYGVGWSCCSKLCVTLFLGIGVFGEEWGLLL